MAVPVSSTLDFANTARITNLPDGVGAQEPATVAQLTSAVEGLAWKDSARVASTANVTLTAPGTAIDGITLANGDRVLLKNQTAGADNGIYIFNGSAATMTRALDMNSAPEVEAAVVTVEEGTANAGTTWRQTAVNVTLGTTTLTWVAFGTAAPAASETTAGIMELATQAETDAGTDDLRAVTPLKLATYSGRIRKFSNTYGDAAATSITVTHNLNTTDVHVQAWETGGSKRQLSNLEVQATGVNSVTLVFAAAPALNSVRVVVLG